MASKSEPPFLALTSRGCGIRGRQPKRFTMGLTTVGIAAAFLAIVLVKLSPTAMMTTKTFFPWSMLSHLRLLPIRPLRPFNLLGSRLPILPLFVISRPRPRPNNLRPILPLCLFVIDSSRSRPRNPLPIPSLIVISRPLMNNWLPILACLVRDLLITLLHDSILRLCKMDRIYSPL